MMSPGELGARTFRGMGYTRLIGTLRDYFENKPYGSITLTSPRQTLRNPSSSIALLDYCHRKKAPRRIVGPDGNEDEEQVVYLAKP